MSEPEATAERPVLRIVRGEPDPVELAVLVAVMTAAASGGADPAPSSGRGAWAHPSRMVRGPLPFGGWRSSFAPR